MSASETLKPDRILILTADMGFGHRAAANAIAEELAAPGREPVLVEIFNPFNHPRLPGFMRSSQLNYDKIVREMPDLQRISYKAGDTITTGALLDLISTIFFAPILEEKFLAFQPDLIVTTYHLFIAPIESCLNLIGKVIPIVTVVTDLAQLHQNWFHKSVTLTLLPTEEAYQEALARNIPRERLAVTGVPVRKSIRDEKRPADQIREELGWDNDLVTVLVVGSKRVKNLEHTLHTLNHSGWQLQWVFVAGGDEKLINWFHAQEWHTPAFIYDYTDEIGHFMHAADVIITKAGGLVMSEALACGLPMLIVDITPGQEDGNAEYLVANGAGSVVHHPIEALETLTHWLINDKEVLHQIAANARKVGKPGAAQEAGNLLMQTIQRTNIIQRGSW